MEELSRAKERVRLGALDSQLLLLLNPMILPGLVTRLFSILIVNSKEAIKSHEVSFHHHAYKSPRLLCQVPFSN